MNYTNSNENNNLKRPLTKTITGISGVAIAIATIALVANLKRIIGPTKMNKISLDLLSISLITFIVIPMVLLSFGLLLSHSQAKNTIPQEDTDLQTYDQAIEADNNTAEPPTYDQAIEADNNTAEPPTYDQAIEANNNTAEPPTYDQVEQQYKRNNPPPSYDKLFGKKIPTPDSKLTNATTIIQETTQKQNDIG